MPEMPFGTRPMSPTKFRTLPKRRTVAVAGSNRPDREECSGKERRAVGGKVVGNLSMVRPGGRGYYDSRNSRQRFRCCFCCFLRRLTPRWIVTAKDNGE